MFVRFPKLIISLFVVLSLIGGFLAYGRIQFEFDFEQFFPEGDEDLEFFLAFKERFEPDDNFLLVGIHREEGVFEQDFLQRVLDFSLDARRVEYEVPEALNENQRVYKKQLNASGDSSIFIRPVLQTESL